MLQIYVPINGALEHGVDIPNTSAVLAEAFHKITFLAPPLLPEQRFVFVPPLVFFFVVFILQKSPFIM